jgi:hypothetical protein
VRERKNWLKSLGFADEERRLSDDWRSYDGGFFRDKVNFPQKPDVQPGDGLILYASGTGLVFAAATAISHPYPRPDANPEAPWWVNVDIVAAVDYIHDGVTLDALDVDGRAHNVRVRRRSHVNLTQREYDAAVEALNNA